MALSTQVAVAAVKRNWVLHRIEPRLCNGVSSLVPAPVVRLKRLVSFDRIDEHLAE